MCMQKTRRLQREGSWFGKDSRSRTWADKDNQTKH